MSKPSTSDLIKELSNLSRVIRGGDFSIIHEESSGLFKVSFVMTRNSRYDHKPMEIDAALSSAIEWLKAKRKKIDKKYTYEI